MLKPKEIFQTLVTQNVIKTTIDYNELLNKNINIIVKVNTKNGQFYHVDLHQNIINLNDNYRVMNDQNRWIETAITKRFIRAYSTELNEATVYKNIEDFDEFLIDDYENVVYDFLNNTPKQNELEWGEKNPLNILNQIEIEIFSDNELEKLLQKYESNDYKSLAHYLEKSYLKRKNDLLKSQESAIKNIKKMSNFILNENNLRVTHIDSNWHKNINELIEIIERNIAYEIEEIDLMAITNTIDYPTEHIQILALY